MLPVAGSDGPRTTWGWRVAPGLAITRSIGNQPGWAVTHLPSGRMAIETYPPALAAAHALASRLAAAGVDWTRPGAEIIADSRNWERVRAAFRAFLDRDCVETEEIC